jgi:hypothetical protein
MLKDFIEATPKLRSAPDMSRHGRFPTSAGLGAAQWRGNHGGKVLAARKGAQAKW